MTEEQLERLNDFCGVAEKDLDRIKDQIGKIIEIRKRKATESGDKHDDTMLEQAEGVLSTMEGLEKINLKLPGAIQEIKELCKKVHALLGPKVALKEPLSDELNLLPDEKKQEVKPPKDEENDQKEKPVAE